MWPIPTWNCPQHGQVDAHNLEIDKRKPVNGSAVADVAAEFVAVTEDGPPPQPGVLQTRPCGSMHHDGVFCLIPVLFEVTSCGCADTVYEHDGQPHEAVSTEGIKYRWEEVLIIQDMPYNAYGPMPPPDQKGASNEVDD